MDTRNQKWFVWGIIGATLLIVVAGGLILQSLLTKPTSPDGATSAGGNDFFSRIFGGGGGDEGTIPVGETPEETLPEVARLKQLTATAVAGFGTRPSESGVLVRYLERETGNIFEIPADGATSSVRISNTTIPRTQEAVFSATSLSSFARLLRDDVIETLYIPLVGSTTLPSLFLEPDITAFAASPTEERIFYLLKTASGSIGYVANSNGGRTRQVFSSPLQQLTADWSAADKITLTSKAAEGYDGIAYAVNPSTGATKKLIGALPGLLVKSSADGAYTLYSVFAEESAQTLVRIEKTGESRLAPFLTLPEKCAWSGNSPVFYCAVPYQSDEAAYPDNWYMGKAATADNIWAVDVENNVAFVLYDLSARSFPPLDVDMMRVTHDNQYLIFREKAGQTLWSFRIIPPQTPETGP